jgi:hypothetical protein
VDIFFWQIKKCIVVHVCLVVVFVMVVDDDENDDDDDDDEDDDDDVACSICLTWPKKQTMICTLSLLRSWPHGQSPVSSVGWRKNSTSFQPQLPGSNSSEPWPRNIPKTPPKQVREKNSPLIPKHTPKNTPKQVREKLRGKNCSVRGKNVWGDVCAQNDHIYLRKFHAFFKHFFTHLKTQVFIL